MAQSRERTPMSSTVGLILFAVVVLAEGALFEGSLPAEAPAWLVGGFPVIAVVGLLAYLLLVYLPQRQFQRESLERQEMYQRLCEAVEEALDDLKVGDLVKTIDDRGGMTGAFKVKVKAAVRALDGLIRQIQMNSVDVANAAQGVMETSSELASGSSQQAAAVVEITATMEELARTAAQIATNAATQAELSSSAERSGTKGSEAVEAALAGMESVQRKMEAIATRTDELGKRSHEIFGVLDLINEIAQETHILALNAAIEASAAGESGDRFGVVASEVRRLAERSKESVDSVRNLLDDFSSSLREAVVATEEGGKAATHVLERARLAASAIAELRGALVETVQASREISLATQEQQTASDQVVLTVKEVSEVIQKMADGLRDFTGAAERLNQVALSIQLLTQSFRIESERSLKNLVVSWTNRLEGFVSHGEVVEGVLREVVQQSPYVELAYVVDPRGAMIGFQVNPELIGERQLPAEVSVGHVYEDRPWFQGLMRARTPIVTSVYESLLTSQQCFTVAAPVFDPQGEVEGVLGVDVNVRNWTRI